MSSSCSLFSRDSEFKRNKHESTVLIETSPKRRGPSIADPERKVKKTKHSKAGQEDQAALLETEKPEKAPPHSTIRTQERIEPWEGRSTVKQTGAFSSDEDNEEKPRNKRPRRKRKLDDKDTAELRTTVFVGNLPATVDKKALTKVFEKYGEIQSIRIRSIPLKEGRRMPKRAAAHTGEFNEQGTCNAYVVFAEKQSVRRAQEMNMKMFEGHHIRVDKATPRAGMVMKGRNTTSQAQSVYDSKRSIFIGNLDYNVQDEDLIQLFDNGRAAPLCAGMVEAVRVVRDVRTRLGKGFAFVKFKTKEAAVAAMRLDGFEFQGRQIRVKVVNNSKTANGLGKTQSKRMKKGASWQGVRTKGSRKIIRNTPGHHREKPLTKGAHKVSTKRPGRGPAKARDVHPNSRRPRGRFGKHQ